MMRLPACHPHSVHLVLPQYDSTSNHAVLFGEACYVTKSIKNGQCMRQIE